MAPQEIPLTTEDKVRMARLYEEVCSRLQEMALITGRTLGMSTDNLDYTFRRLKNTGQAAPQLDALIRFQGIEIICSPTGGCGCYDYDAGICFPC